ncbi:MAG: hypothetical protein RR323_03855, partial [Raoultibacter sp.]
LFSWMQHACNRIRATVEERGDPGMRRLLGRHCCCSMGNCIPNLLGALVLKSAAYCADWRDRHRHLDDVALLSSLITDHKEVLDELHGSDRKRLRAAAEALSDPNDSAWMKLNPENQKAGQMTLHILSA